MNTLQIDIIDQSLYETVIKFLNQLPQNSIRVTTKKQVEKKSPQRHFNAISIQTKNLNFDRDVARNT